MIPEFWIPSSGSRDPHPDAIMRHESILDRTRSDYSVLDVDEDWANWYESILNGTCSDDSDHSVLDLDKDWANWYDSILKGTYGDDSDDSDDSVVDIEEDWANPDWNQHQDALLNWYESILDGTYPEGSVRDQDWAIPITVMYYHPVENQWREMETDITYDWSNCVFRAQETFHLLTESDLWAHAQHDFELDELSWNLLHTLHVANEDTFFRIWCPRELCF